MNANGIPRTAMYLRCYPYDKWEMSSHQGALMYQAYRLGLPEPAVLMDNGHPSTRPLPALERLIGLIDGGVYNVIFVPGPFVFSLDDREARAVVRHIQEAGCQMVEIPPRRSRTRAGEIDSY
ncbi:hypothetical protein G3I60_21040 [Streptomyces sp. SID13666]|uniref:hypothetical protein n=1 Tax=unclassified Streptomyces TaxID=2593676 RepID=UPI0013BF0694|nr:MULTISPECIES: hypothetical protein [unclassified Streptomyces]NEA56553.1 hypothetical protein [Streptomyces sp. SID13666]NEA72347.1 hypothetical protein [Streptomyces sp. SID13588]